MVPDYWTSKPLRELVSISKGKKVLSSDTWEQDSIPYIGANAFKGNFTVFTSSKNAVIGEQDDILILWDGERSGLVATGLHGAVSSTVARLRSKSEVNPCFLYYFIDSKFRWIQERRTGLAVPHVPKDLKDLLIIDFPPLPEQKKIAAILSSVDDAIQATQAVIDQTHRVKQGLLQQLLTRGIGHTQFKQTVIGEIPEGWEVRKLRTVAHIQTGIAKGKKCLEDPIELPYLRVANVQDGYIDITEIKTITVSKREVERYSLQEGDVLLTEGGDFDKLGRGDVWHGQIEHCLHQNHVFAVRTDRSAILPEFYSAQVSSVYGKKVFFKLRKTNHKFS